MIGCLVVTSCFHKSSPVAPFAGSRRCHLLATHDCATWSWRDCCPPETWGAPTWPKIHLKHVTVGTENGDSKINRYTTGVPPTQETPLCNFKHLLWCPALWSPMTPKRVQVNVRFWKPENSRLQNPYSLFFNCQAGCRGFKKRELMFVFIVYSYF